MRLLIEIGVAGPIRCPGHLLHGHGIRLQNRLHWCVVRLEVLLS